MIHYVKHSLHINCKKKKERNNWSLFISNIAIIDREISSQIKIINYLMNEILLINLNLNYSISYTVINLYHKVFSEFKLRS